jgi:hypothetical protein
VVIFLVCLLAGCGPSVSPAEEAADAIEDYVDALVAAWETGDGYEVARYFDESAEFVLAQPDRTLSLSAAFPGIVTSGEGRQWVATWIGSQTIVERRIEAIHPYAAGVMVLSILDALSTASLSTNEIEDGMITRRSTLRWRSAHPVGGYEDARLAWVDDLVDTYLAGWSDGDLDTLDSLYDDDAIMDLGTAGTRTDVTEAVASGAGLLPGAEIPVLHAGEHFGRAIFVEPRSDTRWIAFVVSGVADTCPSDHVVTLNVADGRIVFEGRAPSLASIRECASEDPAGDGWWTDLRIPPPVEEQVTGEHLLSDGSIVEVRNGSPEMEALLAWGIGRFADGGLPVPAVQSITFGPVPACEGRTGVVHENDDGGPDLVVCMDAFDSCTPSREECTGFNRSTRLALLHELGHVWLLVHVDDATAEELMTITGARAWRSAAVPWHERGVEHAAEILAWGLMDEPIELARIGRPSCHVIVDAYRELTEQTPLNSCTASS